MKAAIAGTGFMGRVHAQAVQSNDIEILGFVGSSLEKSNEIAKSFGGARGYSTIEELLDQKPDVLHICTPNSTHLEYVKAAAERGIGVVVEKPITSTFQDATVMLSLVPSLKVHAVPFVYRYHPIVLEIRKRVLENTSNNLWLLHGSYLQDWLAGSMTQNWRSNSALAGQTRAFGDIGVHWCDLMEFVTGHRITRLNANMARISGIDTEDGVTLSFETDKGAIGSTVISQCSAGRSNRLWFSFDGTEESYSFDQEHPETGWVGTLGDNRVIRRDPNTQTGLSVRPHALPAGHPQGYQNCFNDFAADVYAKAQGEADSEVMPTIADGYRAAVIAEAVLKSCETQSWVDVAPIAHSVTTK
jgi:predicted dehydrogenase